MDLLFLVLSLFMFITLIIITYKTKHSSPPNKLPPGSFGWPFIGETLEFLYSNPKKFIHDRMNKHSSEVFKTSVFGERTAVVCGPSGHKFLFSNKDIAAWRTPSIEKLFRNNNKAARHEPDPPLKECEDSRILLQLPTFLKPKAIMDYLPVMNSIAKYHLDMHWNPFFSNEDQQNVVIKVFPLAKRFTLSLACRLFLGLDDPDRLVKLVGEFDVVTEGLGVAAVEVPGTAFYRARKAVEAIRRELRLIVKEKAGMEMEMEMVRTEVLQDMLGYMMGLRDGGGRLLREGEIADKMMGLLVAGYSTVASVITFLMKYIGMHSHVYDEVLREQREIMNTKGGKESGTLGWEDIQKMKYSWNVAQEVMRLVPPLQGTFREALADLTFAGFTIPKGWKIYWSVSSTNKNPEYFPDPEKFDPSRYAGTGPPSYIFVPFGGGARTCPGKEYARAAVLMFLHNVVKRFKWETVFPDEKIISQMMPSPQLGLPVRLSPHIAH